MHKILSTTIFTAAALGVMTTAHASDIDTVYTVKIVPGSANVHLLEIPKVSSGTGITITPESHEHTTDWRVGKHKIKKTTSVENTGFEIKSSTAQSTTTDLKTSSSSAEITAPIGISSDDFCNFKFPLTNGKVTEVKQDCKTIAQTFIYSYSEKAGDATTYLYFKAKPSTSNSSSDKGDEVNPPKTNVQPQPASTNNAEHPQLPTPEAPTKQTSSTPTPPTNGEPI